MSSTVFQPTGYGLETFMARYALHPEETWEEACRRIANSISAAENGGRIEWEEKFYNELVSNRFIPGGRIIYGCGRAKAAMINCFVIGGEDMDSREGWGKYLSQMLVISGLGGGVGINCIKGSEKVITDRGLFEAKDLAGEVHNVLASDGVFRPAMWSSYGEQELFKVTFSNGDVVYCTEDHDWITVAPKGKRVRTKTKNLVGHTVPVVSATDFSYEDGGTESYLEGVRNGLVFGDGTIRTDRDYSYVSQFGENQHLVERYFTTNTKRQYAGWVGGEASFSSALPSHYKEIPSPQSKSIHYLRGFLAGVIAADGHVDKKLGVEIFNEDPSNLEKIREIASACGIGSSSVSTHFGDTNFKKNRRIARLRLHKDAFLRWGGYDEALIIKDLHRENAAHNVTVRKETASRKVMSVEPTGMEEEVFCCVEPVTRSFTLHGGILTGNCSEIRPRGMPIRGVGGEATGAVSYMNLINSVGEEIKGGGGRRAALMLCLNIDHPDIEEFIDKKFFDMNRIKKMDYEELYSFIKENFFIFDESFHQALRSVWDGKNEEGRTVVLEFIKAFLEKRLKNANVSVVFNDDPNIFFEKVRNDEDHELLWKGQVVKTIPARKLWQKIVKNALKGGEPGVLNLYHANKMSNIPSVGPVVSTNPCGEIPMTAGEVCCLGQVVLPRFVKNGDVDLQALAHTVHVGIRFLDNVLDVNTYPNEEIRQKATSTRRIGLGITGLHDMLLKLGLKYSSPEGRAKAQEIMKFIANRSYEASVLLGVERGVFPAYRKEDIEKSGYIKKLKPSIKYLIKEKGLRNCAVNSIAPCGTNSIISGVSSGIEPIMGFAYKRTAWRGDDKETKIVVHDLFRSFVEEGKDVDHFEHSEDVDMSAHFEMQVALQKYVDQAISKTILLPQGYSSKRYSEQVMEYLPELKGLTIYPIGSRGESPIVPLTKEEAIAEVHKSAHSSSSDEEESQAMAALSCPSGVCEL